jgi:hypothetical protein
LTPLPALLLSASICLVLGACDRNAASASNTEHALASDNPAEAVFARVGHSVVHSH